MSDSSSLVHAGTGDDFETGLEDFDVSSDAVVPRIKIVHSEGVFQDTLSNEKFSEMNVILLGLVKQRILWHTDVADDALPLCKSYNFKAGIPGKEFPWKESLFDKAEAEASSDDQYGVVLPCDGCQLKEWGTDPRNGKAPWCTEQHTYPLLYDVGNGTWAPAILTVQKTGIKPSKAYCTGFARSRTPLFTVHTGLTLTTEKRGSVVFSTPNFAKGDPTDPARWPAFKEQFVVTRNFLAMPPGREDESSASKPSASSSAVAAPAKARPAPANEAAADDDAEPPF